MQEISQVGHHSPMCLSQGTLALDVLIRVRLSCWDNFLAEKLLKKIQTIDCARLVVGFRTDVGADVSFQRSGKGLPWLIGSPLGRNSCHRETSKENV